MKAVCESAELLLNLHLVLDDVVIPHFNGVSVVRALVADGLNLEATTLDGADIPVERARGVGAREDVLAHENSPNEVFVLPETSETRNLEEENAVVLEKGFDLSHEVLIVSYTDVLTHLEASDLVELTDGLSGEFTVVLKDKLHFAFKTFCFDASIGVVKLTLRNGHASAVDVKVFGAVNEPRTPAATKVEDTITVLQVKELSADSALSLLRNLERVRAVIGNTAGVKHGIGQERMVEVVT